MKIVSTESATLPDSDTERLHVYNALDVMVTLEVLHAIRPQLDEVTSRVYQFERDLQGPVLEMECRGVLVDMRKRSEVSALFILQLATVEESLREILRDGIGVEINWNSPKQLGELFYDVMGFPEVRKRGPSGMVRTTGRAALEKLQEYFYAEPIVRHILAIRDLKKKLGVLKTGIDSDGRIRTSYNIAGTDTGRFSSYTSAFGSGTNLQNITGELRSIFTADPGHKLYYIDLEQAESRAVAAIVWNLFHDGDYLDACESGDLHTSVCRMCFDTLPWTGDKVSDKLIAKRPFYRHFDYRDVSKRLGHATNYFGKPPHISKLIHIPFDLVNEFQVKYFRAFPGIRSWHDWVRNKLNCDGWITTFMGMRRWFFGRRWDEETLRAAIAFEPQSAVAYILNTGMLNVWRNPPHPKHQLLLQVHDAIVGQYPEELEHEVVPQVQTALRIEVPLLHGRSLIIPTEAFTGWNWSYSSPTNVDGLIPYKGQDGRKRQDDPSRNFLDRRFL